MPEYIVKIKLLKRDESIAIPKDAIGVTLHILRHGEREPVLVDVAWLEEKTS